MGIGGRAAVGILSAAVAYFMYVYLPEYLLDFVSGDSIELSTAKISIGSFEDLVFYIKFLGFMIVGLSFAQSMAHPKSVMKGTWKLIRVFFSIAFWAIFIYVDFNTIAVNSAINAGTGLLLNIDITGLFYVFMGANIFDLVLAILDITIAVKKEDD